MAVELEGLRTVIYPAPDLDRAKAWWTDFLGHGPYFDEPFYVGYEVAGYELGLLPTADPDDGALTYWGVAGRGGGRRQRPRQRAPPSTRLRPRSVTASSRPPYGPRPGSSWA